MSVLHLVDVVEATTARDGVAVKKCHPLAESLWCVRQSECMRHVFCCVV